MRFYLNISTIIISCLLFACSASEYEYPDNNNVSPESIVDIQLKPNHFELVADGKAEIDFNPVLFKTEEKIPVLDDRIDPSWIKYKTVTGEEISRTFSTSDPSFVGSTIEVFASVNNVVSDTIYFTVKAPLETSLYNEITFPVVFHITQAKDEVLNYGGEIPAGKIDKLLKRMNDVCSGELSNSPVGTDTKIRFKPALYNPDGEDLREPGINRFIVDGQVNSDNMYKDFIRENSNINWPYDKYLNIWIFTDSQRAYSDFSFEVTELCKPNAVFTGTDLSNKPQGLNLVEVNEGNWNPVPQDYGIKIKSNLLNSQKLIFNRESDNDFMHYLGNYFGLLKTHTHRTNATIPDDYCDDTIGYLPGEEFYKENRTTIKETASGYRFVSENIMDDQTGLHKSISEDQMIRIRWVAENCPGRSAWKSDFAFTGED
jgi:zinc-dependent metalloproteinase lipoprotein